MKSVRIGFSVSVLSMKSYSHSPPRLRLDHHRPRANAICCLQNRFFGIPFANLMRRIQCSIDPTRPVLCTVLQYRKFKVERLPISIENDVRQYPFVLQFPSDCEAVRAGDQSG